MSDGKSHESILGITISGLIGIAIGAGGVLISQKQAVTAENQYYMELDQLRHSAILDEGMTFEARRDYFAALEDVKENGFRSVFEKNLQRDVAETEESIRKIEEARTESESAAQEARRKEIARAESEAQQRKIQAVRTNPLIYDNCGRGTNRICP